MSREILGELAGRKYMVKGSELLDGTSDTLIKKGCGLIFLCSGGVATSVWVATRSNRLYKVPAVALQGGLGSLQNASDKIASVNRFPRVFAVVSDSEFEMFNQIFSELSLSGTFRTTQEALNYVKNS